MPECSVDVVTLIFVLSAVHPDKMKLALQNISRVRAETASWNDSVKTVDQLDHFKIHLYHLKVHNYILIRLIYTISSVCTSKWYED